MEQYRPYGRNGYSRNGYNQYSNTRCNNCQSAINNTSMEKISMNEQMKNCMGNHVSNCAGNCPVGMAYVPSQEFGELYDANKGLKAGTIFPELNLIFCGVRGKCK